MAVAIRGDVPLTWGSGLGVIANIINESYTEANKTGELEIADEQGDFVTNITNFEVKTETTLELIPLESVTPPNVSDELTYGPSGNTKTIIITTFDRKFSNKNVEKWTIKGSSYPNITLP